MRTEFLASLLVALVVMASFVDTLRPGSNPGDVLMPRLLKQLESARKNKNTQMAKAIEGKLNQMMEGKINAKLSPSSREMIKKAIENKLEERPLKEEL